ncbi:hypothetical protein AB1484_31450 [Parafrankia sp. FMc6]|uniref:hypothetical protein n=1 Tax=Parafrankia soli TaxID=2599596 RepID=UPI0034D48004
MVIATSGMLTAGPAVRWARELLPDARAGLMVVGYQDEDSPAPVCSRWLRRAAATSSFRPSTTGHRARCVSQRRLAGTASVPTPRLTS